MTDKSIDLLDFVKGLGKLCRESTHPDSQVREQLGHVAGLIDGALAKGEARAAIEGKPQPTANPVAENNWWSGEAIDTIRSARMHEPHDTWDDWHSAIKSAVLRAYNRGKDEGRSERVLEAPPREGGERDPLRKLAYEIYDKVMELENGEGGCSLYDYCLTPDISPDAPVGAITVDDSKVDHLLEPIITILRRQPTRAAAPLPTSREAASKMLRQLSCYADKLYMNLKGQYLFNPENFSKAGVDQLLGEWDSLAKRCYEVEESLIAPQPISGLQRTAGDVLRQFRESGSEDWGELESAINWWAMNDFCPNFTKGDRAVSEGRLREASTRILIPLEKLERLGGLSPEQEKLINAARRAALESA